jgi:hypothetical protein
MSQVLKITNDAIKNNQKEIREIIELMKALSKNKNEDSEETENKTSDNSTTSDDGTAIGKWEELKINTEYEINDSYPYKIRKKGRRNRFLKETPNTKDNYIYLSIGKKHPPKHRVVAQQWIPNPDNLPFVDHTNHKTNDYHIENLRWISESNNGYNKKGLGTIEYEWFNESSESKITIDKFNGWEFKNFFFDNGDFYLKSNDMYRKLVVLNKKVNLNDTTGKFRSIMINKFNIEYSDKIKEHLNNF